jgi:hypothetical protein
MHSANLVLCAIIIVVETRLNPNLRKLGALRLVVFVLHRDFQIQCMAMLVSGKVRHRHASSLKTKVL